MIRRVREATLKILARREDTLWEAITGAMRAAMNDPDAIFEVSLEKAVEVQESDP